jgi:PAS domain S-box-containing protein
MILIVLSLMAFFSTLTGGFFYYASQKESAFKEANKQAVLHIETIKRHLSYFASENMKSAKALAGLKELSNALSRKDKDALAKVNAILDHFSNAYQVDVCYLIDRDGNTIASSNRNSSDSFVGQNYAFRPYFQHAIKGNPTIFFGYMALGVTSGKRGIYYSHSVYEDGEDKPIGVAVIKASVDPMEREFVKDYKGIVMLTDPHGIVFISNRNELILQTLSKLSPEEITQIRRYKQFGKGHWDWTGLNIIDEAQAIDSLGNKYLFHKLAMDNYPGWNLVYLSDIKSIFKIVSGPLIKITGYLILILCVFIGLTVFILYRQANREIDQRKIAEEALRKAHKDLEKRVEERTSDLIKSVDELKKEIVERKRAEYALRGSEEKYRTLTENLNVGVFRTTPGPKGKYIEANPAYAKMFGFDDKKALLSFYAYDLYQTPDDRDRFSKKMLKDGTVRNEEVMLKKRNGTPFIGSVTAVAVKDDNGEVKYYDGILEDITELKQAEEALSESERRLRFLSSKLLSAQEEERKQISLELHDEMGQALTAIGISLKEIEEELPSDLYSTIGENLSDIHYLIDKASRQISELSLDLRPSMLDDLGLVPTLRWFINKTAKRTKLNVKLETIDIGKKLDSDIETVLYRVTQEAINNIVKHAEAKHVIVRLELNQESIALYIKDDGKGFDVEEALMGQVEGRIGLLGMQERAAIVRGSLSIQSRKGHGTVILAEIPLH